MSRWMGIVLASVALVGLCSAQELPEITGQQKYVFVLGPSSPEVNDPTSGAKRNFFFTYDPSIGANGRAIAIDRRVADLLGTSGPNIVSLSFGRDQVDYAHPHGDLHFVAGARTASAGTAASGGDLLLEPPDDFRADLYYVNNVVDPSGNWGTNQKSVEENEGQRARFQSPEFAKGSTFGLTGGSTGSTIGAIPSEVVGIDYHPPVEVLGSLEEFVFFTIDAPWTDNGVTYHPHQVLKYDFANDSLSVYLDLSLGQAAPLQAGDIIDAISVDLYHGPAINQPESVIFSLRWGSPTLDDTGVTLPLSGADLFQHPAPSAHAGYAHPLEDLIYRRAFANSQDPRDAEIGGVISIDPLIWYRYSIGSITTSGPETGQLTIASVMAPVDEYVLEDGGGGPSGEPNFYPGDVTTPHLANPLEEGERRYIPMYGSVEGAPVALGGLAADFEYPNQPENPASDIQGFWIEDAGGPGIDYIVWSWTLDPTASSGTYEASFDGQAPFGVSGTAAQIEGDFLPGSYSLGVRFTDAYDQKSAFHYGAILIPSTVPTPSLDSVAVIGSPGTGQSIELDVSNLAGVSLLEVELDGATISANVSALDEKIVTEPIFRWGIFPVEIRSYTAAGDASYAVKDVVYVPRPRPGDVLGAVSLGFVPGSVAVVDNGGAPELRVFDLATSTVQSYDFDLNPIGVPVAPGSLPTPYYRTACTGFGSTLLWLGHDAGGNDYSLFDGGAAVGPLLNYGLPESIGAVSSVPDATPNFYVSDLSARPYGFPVQYRHVDQTGALVEDSPVVNSPLPYFGPDPWGSWEPGGFTFFKRGDDRRLLIPHHESWVTTALVEIDLEGRIRGAVDVDLAGSTRMANSLAHWAADVNHPSSQVDLVFVTTLDGYLYKVAAPRGLLFERDRHRDIHGAIVGEMASPTPMSSESDADGAIHIETVTIADDVTIGDMDVELAGTHPKPHTLSFELVSPRGTSVVLHAFSPMGDTPGTFEARFDDVYSGLPDDRAGNTQPSEVLSEFDDESSSGSWHLIVRQQGVVSDIGVLDHFRISILPAPLDEERWVRPGDADGNGTVDNADLTLIVDFLLGNLPAFFCLEAYDFEQDGDVDADDAWALFAALNGSSSFPCVQETLDNDVGCQQSSCP